MMLDYRKIGYFLKYIVVFLYCTNFTKAEVKSVSACHGTSSPTCNYITLECEPGSRIRLLSMKYGVKDSNCNNRRNQCLKANRNGCCAFNTEDCMDYYNDLHAYDLHKKCSGKQNCGPMPVPVNILSSCDGRTSTYAYVTYECVPDESIVSLCRVDNYDDIQDTNVNVMFNSSGDIFSSPTNCSCFITSISKIYLDYVDIRMIKTETSGQGSDCCSATLKTVPDDNINTECRNDWNEPGNFIHNLLGEADTLVELKLLNLYRSGIGDAPIFIWLNVYAENQNNVNVQCFKHADYTTLPPPQTTSKGDTVKPSNTTDPQPSPTGDEDSNTGAIVAGILVPIILLAVVAVVIFLVRKRRGYLCKKKQKHATPNKYTERAEIENSVENSEYAEIGFVPDVPSTEPTYDQVYEPSNKKTAQELNGHTYQNVGNSGKDKGKQSKTSKSRFGKLKSHTNRFISFFKNQTDSQQVQKRDRENSAGTYDHLRPVSANSEVRVEVTPPSQEPMHTYSHTNDESVKRQIAMNQNEKDARTKKNKASPIIEKHPKDSAEDINAFHVGDSYIEFQFGTVDENHPDLVKSPKDTDNSRPAPPNRPPPSPRTAAKSDKIPTPKSSPNQARPVLNVKTDDKRSKSPNFLSPGHKSPDVASNYDYATGTHVRPRSQSPCTSDVSDVSSEHSYKILEKQEVYDYADVSDDEGDEEHTYTSGSLYEDVDKDPRSVSVRKHKSATEVPLDTNGYLEPVTSRTRAISSPGAGSDLKEHKNKPSTQVSTAGLLSKELKEKTQQKKQTKGNANDMNKHNAKSSNSNAQKVGEDSNTVKSDNVDAKDYQKVDRVKGVLKMAQIFETKDSESDSSRQSSPRNIQVTNLPKNSPNFKTSDA